MADERDEVLLQDPNDSEFSGFGPEELEPRSGSNNSSKKKENKKGKKPSKTSSSATAKNTKSSNEPRPSTSSAEQVKERSSFEKMIDSLTDSEIMQLRSILGFDDSYANDEDFQYLFGDSLENMPNLHIEVTEESDGELASAPKVTSTSKKSKREPLEPAKLSQNLINAMFEPQDVVESNDCQEHEIWDLPKLKGPVKGPAISQSLANLINATCTSQCVTDELVAKYKVPENCDKLCSPMVNNEIWKIMNKRAQSYDKCFSDIQNLVATGVVPIIKLLELVKPHIAGNTEAKTLFSDVITLMGQVQYNLSLRRRYMIKPHLKKKYQNLCHISMPVSTKLFGDDITKDVKNCDTGISIAKENYPAYYNRPYRGRGAFRAGYSRGMRSNYRYQPYPQNMQYGGMFRADYGYGMYPRGFPRQRFGSARGRKPTVSATVSSAPNETA